MQNDPRLSKKVARGAVWREALGGEVLKGRKNQPEKGGEQRTNTRPKVLWGEKPSKSHRERFGTLEGWDTL